MFQAVLLDLEHLLNHHLMLTVISAEMGHNMIKTTQLLVKWHTTLRGGTDRKPETLKSIEKKLHRMVLGALRSVENGRRSWTFETRYFDAIQPALKLLKGAFCEIMNENICCVCLEECGMASWISQCGHSFHTGCIVTHLKNDQRCPLCRVEM